MPCPRSSARAIASAVSRSESIRVPSRSNRNPRTGSSLPSELAPVALIADQAADAGVIDELAERQAHLETEAHRLRGVVVPLAVDIDLVAGREHERVRWIAAVLGR